MQEGAERFGHKIHAFCLMTNHCHLAIQVGEAPLSRIIQNLSFRYTVWINKCQKRSGHLFQGRYKAILVDGDAYLLELVRYIHLNPVRATLTGFPEEYPWSSHRVYCGAENLLWVTTDWVLSQLSVKKDSAQKQCRQFIHDGLSGDYCEAFRQRGQIDNRVLGDECFAEQALRAANERFEVKIGLEQLLSNVSRYYEMDIGRLRAAGKARKETEARAVTALLVQEYVCGTLTALAQIFNRDVTGLSSAVRRLEEKIMNSSEVAKRVVAIKAQIAKSQASGEILTDKEAPGC